jgi:hypothetical protein
MDVVRVRAASLGAVAVGAAFGLAPVWLSIHPFTLSVGAYLLCTLVLEARRRSLLHPVPWWVAHLFLIPWAAVVLLPWAYYRQQGSWFILGASIDVDLPQTWSYNLLALVGMTVGSLVALSRVTEPARTERAPRVDWLRCSAVLAALVGLFLLSFVIARRPLSALWKLSGEVRYFDDVDQATGLGFLDYATTVASGVLLVACAARRRVRLVPPAPEVAWLGLLSLLTIGSGARGRVLLVVLGWFLLQFRPVIANRFARDGHKALVVVVSAALAVATTFAAVWISDLRTRGQGVPRGSVIARAVTSLDVVGSAELVVMRGAAAGMLGGESYRQLPSLAVPRRYAGEAKASPAADEVIRNLLDQFAGFSAPLWFESVLNYGHLGVFVFSVLLGWAGVLLFVKARARRSSFTEPVLAIGPVWLLISYLVLSRLTLLQFGPTTGSVLLGAFLAAASGAVTFGPQRAGPPILASTAETRSPG